MEILNNIQNKYVLIVDHVGLETQFLSICKKIFPGVIRSKIEELKMSLDINTTKNDSNIILSPVSKLLKSYKITEIIELIYMVKNDSKSTRNVYICLTTKNISDLITLSYLTHLADIVVTFNNKHDLTITSKISGKNIITKQYVYNENESRQSEADSSIVLIRTGTADTKLNPENIGTFKIGINEKDLVSRNALKLPYEKVSETEPQMESANQFNLDDDEEDPDDDLYI